MLKRVFMALVFLATAVALGYPIRSNVAAGYGEEGSGLPYDSEVAYLESTGIQYILTPMLLSDALEYEICAAYMGEQGSGLVIAGARDTTVSPSLRKYIIQNGSTMTHVNTRVQATVPFDHEFHVYFSDETVCGIDGIFRTTSGDAFSNLKFPLFAYNFNGSIVLKSSCRIAYAKFGEAMDLIAVRFTNERGQREGAMYDTVSGILYRNNGTGAFIIGPDKE